MHKTPGRGDSLLQLLRLHNTLALLAVDSLRLLLQSPDSVDTGNRAADQPGQPGPVGVLLQPLGGGQLADANHVDDLDAVQGQVAGVSELATDGQVAKDGVDGALVVQRDGGRLEMLDELADTQDLARRAELLLHGIVGVDGGLRSVGAVQVPGVETRKVLQGAEDLVTADCIFTVWLVSCRTV